MASSGKPGADGWSAQRVIFLHIAKTAGTSLVDYLRRRLPAGSVLSHGDFLKFPGQRLEPELVKGYRLISGHFGYAQIAAYMAGHYSVTFLRDPMARVLSFYKFCLHEDMQKRFPVARSAAQLSVDEFMTSTRPEIVEMLDNQQTWQLAEMYWTADRQRLAHLSDTDLLELAEGHLQNFSLVGFTDTFAEDFCRVISAMGLPQPGRVPQQLRTTEPILPLQLKPETLATLKDRLGLDYQLYERARSRRKHN
jgi:hypothetical protein